MGKLSNEQKEFIKMDLDLGISNTELARRFEVSEGAIRYHKKKRLEQKKDGRKTRYSAVSKYSTPIEFWIQNNLSAEHKKRNTVLSLYQILVQFHNYNLSYDALRRYIKRHHPKIMYRSYYLRVETPPGKLSQIDWKENIKIQLRRPGNWVTVNFLILLLCFSRKPAIVVRVKKDQQSFLSAHYAAVLKLSGITDYIRPDCMSTAVKIWNGRNSEMNADYNDFLKTVGAKGFPARPGTATDKGKVEKKIRDIFRRIDFRQLVFRNLEHLQEFIDQKIEQHSARTICPATGTTIAEAYEYEKGYLHSQIESLPKIPIDSIITPVQEGNLAWFRGNYYQIPEGFIGKRVRCINNGTQITIHYQGKLLETYSYEPDIKGMVRMSRVAAENVVKPLSDLVKSWWFEVADRQIDYYQEITGGAR